MKTNLENIIFKKILIFFFLKNEKITKCCSCRNITIQFVNHGGFTMSTHHHLLFAELLRYLKNKCRLKNKSSKRCVNIVIVYHGRRPPIERGSLAKFREISRQKSLKSENKDVFILGFESMVSKIIMNQ